MPDQAPPERTLEAALDALDREVEQWEPPPPHAGEPSIGPLESEFTYDDCNEL
jgi:hypothetical protein